MDRLLYSEVHEHAVSTLKGLNSLRRECPQLCDFTLYVDGKKLPCHRSVLCLHSEYFRGMIGGKFSENAANMAILKGVSLEQLKVILDFIYTGEIEIDQASVEDIFQTAARLRFQKVIDICVRYLCHQIDETNSIAMYRFGTMQAIPELAAAAKNFTYERLESIFEVDDVVKDMTSVQVEEILQDDLAHLHGEEQMIMSILKWVSFDKDKRFDELGKLIENIDWSRVSTRFILRTLLYHPLVKSNKQAKALIACKVRKVLDDITFAEGSLRVLAINSVQADVDGDQQSDNRISSLHWNRSDRTRIQDHFLGGEKVGCMQEALLLVGGLTLGEAERGDTTQPNVMCYLPRTNTWQIRADWPERRLRGFSVTKFNNDVIVTGGCNFTEMKRNNIKNAWMYSAENDTWERLPNMTHARSFHSSCQVNNELFAIGGAFNNKIDMEVYHSHSTHWISLKQNAPRFVWNFTVAVCNGKIILIGSGENSLSLVLQCYNTSVAQWSQFRSPNVPRHLSAPLCSTSPDCGLVFLTGDNSQKMFVFNPNTNLWSRVRDMHDLHANGGMTTVGGAVYLTGGHWEDDGYLDEMESFDIKTGIWSAKGLLPHLWLYHGCTSVKLSI